MWIITRFVLLGVDIYALCCWMWTFTRFVFLAVENHALCADNCAFYVAGCGQLRALRCWMWTVTRFVLLAVENYALCVAGCGQLRALCCWLLQIAWSSGVGPKGQVWTTYSRVGRDWYFGIILAAAMETGSSFSLTPADAGFGFVREREREGEREMISNTLG